MPIPGHVEIFFDSSSGLSNQGAIMTKSDLIAQVAKGNRNLNRKEVEALVDVIFDAITDTLLKGDRVEIRGFGSFKVKQREARVGRNPRTGEAVQIPAKRVPLFKVGKKLQEMVNRDHV
jgi:integration host factor subunit beta